MIFSSAHFQHLKWHLIIFLSVLCADGSATIASKHLLTHAQRGQRAAQRQLDAARSQLAIAHADRKNMDAYTFEYGDLLKRNIIGGGQRLEWVEGLEKIRQQHRVLDFRYTIAPQHPYTPPSALDSGNFELNMSDMALQFELLHEGQLMDFFDALRTGINGLFILDRCALERNAGSNATPGLKAECTGGWLTLKNRNEK